MLHSGDKPVQKKVHAGKNKAFKEFIYCLCGSNCFFKYAFAQM